VPFSLGHLDHRGSPPVLWKPLLVTGAWMTVAGPSVSNGCCPVDRARHMGYPGRLVGVDSLVDSCRASGCCTKR
jgi:hypothetical protein